jgi:sugar phosphate isomerase/epimerase
MVFHMPPTMKVALIPNDFSMDLEEVFRLCSAEHVQYIELAFMWNKSILDLTPAETQNVHTLLEKYNLKVASIQTQIMKTMAPGAIVDRKGSGRMHSNHDFNIAQMDRAIALAREFKTPYIVTYSYFRWGVRQSATRWEQLFQDYAAFLPKLQASGVTCVVECEPDTFAGTVDQYLRLLRHFESPNVRANLDLANLLDAQKTFTEADFKNIHPYVAYFHVKDRRKMGPWGRTGAVFNEGDVPWRQVLLWFAKVGFNGILSVEPHVHGEDRFELGSRCVRNLQQLLRDLNIPFE